MNTKECITHHHACDCREAEFARLMAENERLKKALTELVACKDLKDRIDEIPIFTKRMDLESEYYRRKQKAWAAARAALSGAKP